MMLDKFSECVLNGEKVPVSFEQMYKQADDSLYKAKTRGRGKYVLYYVHKEREVIH